MQTAPSHTPRLAIATAILLVALIAYCFAMEIWLNPLRPGGSWLAIKALPMLALLRGTLYAQRRSHQWISLAVWLYFMEGCVRAASDAMPLWGYIEAALSLALFITSAAYAHATGPKRTRRRTTN